MTTKALASTLQTRALPALVLGGIAIGCSPVLVRLSELGAVSTAFWRITLALLPLFLMFRSGSVEDAGTGTASTWRQKLLAGLPGVLLGAELATWHISLHMTSVANATLLINMTPISVALLGWLLFRTPISPTFLVGLILAVVGVVVLKGGPASVGSGNIVGDAVALFGSFIYAGYFLVLGRVRDRFSTVTVMWWSTLAAALTVLPFALIFESQFLPLALSGWGVLLALAWICHTGGQGLITFALAWLPPTFSSLTLLIQPIVAALLAWIVLSEPLSITQAAGGLIVLTGILIARKG
ncbi:DMT family transporter [Pseudomonas violetae]|uniref:DMT family transporter n=1 Tax=Pseudomonas violetae TaxID=2915813 RepID=UPI0031F51AF3